MINNWRLEEEKEEVEGKEGKGRREVEKEKMQKWKINRNRESAKLKKNEREELNDICLSVCVHFNTRLTLFTKINCNTWKYEKKISEGSIKIKKIILIL